MNWENSRAATPLKRDFLRAWFAEENRFFLTGGSALGMFYLDHRRSYDLDLFTTEEVDGLELRNRMQRLSAAIGAACRSLQTTPDFHRFELRRDDDREIVDFVIDRIPQLMSEKPVHDGIRIDPVEEILANKWAALLGRSDPKDLIDLYFLEKAGYDLLPHFDRAREKDAGLDSAILSHLLSTVRIETMPDYLIESLEAADLQAFVERIRRELAAKAHPEN